MKPILKSFALFLLFTIIVFGSGCGSSAPTTGPVCTEIVDLFVDDSLLSSFRKLSKTFQKSHPNIKINIEASPSIIAARKVVDMGRRVDLLALSDFATIQRLLMPLKSEWYVCFARNEMVLAYTEQSTGRDRISKANWYRTLIRKDVTFGRADPRTDPCGYRTLLMWKLVDLYQKHRINKKTITEVLSSPERKAVIRPGSLDLLHLLNGGVVDYIFTYRSLAEQHNLQYIRFSNVINLSDPKHAFYYKMATVELGDFELRGSPIVYAFTIPLDAKNPQTVRIFADFLLSDKAALSFSTDHQNVIKGGRIGFTKYGQPFLKE